MIGYTNNNGLPSIRLLMILDRPTLSEQYNHHHISYEAYRRL